MGFHQTWGKSITKYLTTLLLVPLFEFLKQGLVWLYSSGWLRPARSLCGPRWPHPHRDLPAFLSQSVEIKGVCHHTPFVLLLLLFFDFETASY